jgi:trehalose synthase
MLSAVKTDSRRLSDYNPYLERTSIEALTKVARPLRGKRVLHINSTAVGGGVAEILRHEVPLLRDLGIDAEWRVLKGTDAFYEVTKKIHNGLQGNPLSLTNDEWATYEEVNARLADELDGDAWDLVFVHDPQPAAALALGARRGQGSWVWRCHIDSESPNPTYRARFADYTQPYDAQVYSMPQYVLGGGDRAPFIVPPAIDPLSDKCRPIDAESARETVSRFGLDPERPLVTQVSRFDPWKDPIGVLNAFSKARKRVPGLQLALIGSSADDDPESKTVLEEVRAEASDLADAFVLANCCDDRAVKAFQTHSEVVLQKSLREGFGLTVSEALWSGTPVVGGRAGGIPLQIVDGKTGILVTSEDQCTEAIVRLCENPSRATKMGEAGRDHVRRNFLLPRLVHDELSLWREISRGPVGREHRRSPQLTSPAEKT